MQNQQIKLITYFNPKNVAINEVNIIRFEVIEIIKKMLNMKLRSIGFSKLQKTYYTYLPQLVFEEYPATFSMCTRII